MSSTPAVFLDRDGVINRLIYHQEAGIVDSPFTATQFQVFPCVPKAIRLINQLGLPVVIVSNQPGIAKQHFDVELLADLNDDWTLCSRPAGRTWMRPTTAFTIPMPA